MASPSPVTDGQRVIVHFGNGDLASYTFAGQQEWKRNLVADYGPYTIWWGHANSPLLFGDAVISVCMQDSLEGTGRADCPQLRRRARQADGQAVVEGHADDRGRGGGVRLVHDAGPVTRSSGHPEMIVMGGNCPRRLRSGKRHAPLGIAGPSRRTHDHGADGRGRFRLHRRPAFAGPLEAVKLGGRGRLDPAVATAWKYTDSTPDTCCPVVAGGAVYIVSDSGIATCLDARTGKRAWRNRLSSRNFKSSPLAADGHVYFLGHDGECTVVEASREFRIVAKNSLDDEFTASPAVSNGRIYLRGRKALYAIGK